MNLECKLTSCDLKHKRSLLPQIKSWGLLAKLVSVSGPAGTSAGRAGHPRCCHVHEDGSASSSLKAVCPGHNVRPGCGLSIPDGPSLLICGLRDFQVYRTPTRARGARTLSCSSSWLLPAYVVSEVGRAQPRGLQSPHAAPGRKPPSSLVSPHPKPLGRQRSWLLPPTPSPPPCLSTVTRTRTPLYRTPSRILAPSLPSQAQGHHCQPWR